MSQMLSSGLLAASMLLGQTNEPPVVSGKSVSPAPPMAQATPMSQRPILGWFSRDDRPVLNKIQGWFKRDQPEPKPGPYIPSSRPNVIRETPAPPLANPMPTTPTPSSNEFPRKLPNPSSKARMPSESIAKEAVPSAPKEIQPATFEQIAALKNAKTPILPQLANKIGRDDKFEWITGQIEIEGGTYVLYYATPETIDKYNGRLVLQPQQVDLTQFRRGDLVSVRGTIVQRTTVQGMTPAYRVTLASLIERPKS